MMVELGRIISVSGIVGFLLIIVSYATINTAEINANPDVRWVIWDLDRSTAIVLHSTEIFGSMALAVALLWKDNRILLIATLFLAFNGIWFLSDFLTNNSELSGAAARRDMTILTAPILIVVVYLVRKHSRLAKGKNNYQKSARVSKPRSESARWWLKWMPLVLFLIGAPTAVIGPFILYPFVGYDRNLIASIVGLFIILIGVMWFFVSQRMKMYQRSSIS